MKRISFLFALAALMIISFGLAHGQYGGLSLDHMDGLYSGDSVLCSTPIGFHIRLNNTSNCRIGGSTNGFRVWMVGGGLRAPITWGFHEFDPTWAEMYDLTYGLVIDPFGVDGLGSDTVGFGGANLMGPGIPAGFDEEVWHIFTQVDPSAEGDTICIDSCFYPPGGLWFWAMAYPCGSYFPSWGGPYCFHVFHVESSCCNHDGMRGDVDASNSVNVADAVYLVQYIFFGGDPPPCLEEGDVDGSGSINVADAVYLVQYIFFGGPPPLPCP